MGLRAFADTLAGDRKARTVTLAMAVIGEDVGVGRVIGRLVGEAEGVTEGVVYVRVTTSTTVVVVVVVTSVIRVLGGESTQAGPMLVPSRPLSFSKTHL